MSDRRPQIADGGEDAAPPNAVFAALQFLRILRRRKHWMLLSLAAAGIIGAIYYSSAVRIYQARASVLVTQTGPDVWSTSMAGESQRNSLIPTYERLFASDVVLENALQQINEMSAASRIDFAEVPPARHLETLRKSLRAAGVRNTNVIEVTYRSRSPRAAAAIVDAVVQSYLTYMAQGHKNISVENVGLLNQERRNVQEQYRVKERELASARTRAGDLGLRQDGTQTHPTVERAITINQTLIKVQSERLQLEASFAAIKEAVERGGDLQQHLMAVEPFVGRDLIRNALGLGTFEARTLPELETKLLDQQAQLATLLEHYGSRHPQVVELQKSIEHTEQYLADHSTKQSERMSDLNSETLGPALLSIVGEKLAAIRRYEAQLTEHYQAVESEAIALNDRIMEVQLLEHEVDRLRQLHESLLNRIADLDIQEDQSGVRTTIVDDPETDSRPVSPQLRLVGLICILCGSAAGAALAYISDLLDDRFRSPDELSEELGGQILAVIRPLPIGAGRTVTEANAPEMEAFRTLRTTLTFSGDRRRVAFTSAEPGDGKTTVISHVAASYGLAGRRTLVIDADLRKPGLSNLFRLRGLPGLSDILRSTHDIDELCAARIKSTDVANVDILPCGPKPSDPLELLSRPRLDDLLGWAESRYDQVLIDTPPILAASDAAVVGRLTDGVILVVQPIKNDRRLLIRAADDLRLMNVPLVGIVANNVDDSVSDGYGGYGQPYGYGYGFGDEDEHETTTIATPRGAAA
ncbi:MAG: polysaccharide biosynthesis tyrosine autokinase [Planctomycetaceae bacterium]|nr:polysaccharide biosynthesis tyrosine autokinase [Planctomycetaceae bacterium]